MNQTFFKHLLPRTRASFFALLAVLCPLGPLAAQSTLVRGYLTDATTAERLGYVSVGVPGTAFGTVSAPDGSFELSLPAGTTDSVRFVCIGYQPGAVRVADLLASEPVRLQPATYLLPEVSVRPARTNVKTLGSAKTGTDRFVNFALQGRVQQNLGSAIGRNFKLKKMADLDHLRFFVAANNFDTVRFRINVYTVEDGRPATNLCSSQIIVELRNRQTGWIDVDLQPYRLESKGEIVVAVEWVYGSRGGTQLALPIALPVLGSKHFYKYGSLNHWKVFGQMSAPLLLTVRA